MKLPEQIKVRVVVGENAIPMTGAVLSIRLGMPSKNTYTIGPQIADENGWATFEENEIIKEIQLYQKASPMDYSGNLEDCSSLEVAVLGKDDIRHLIAARKLWGQGVPEWRLNERELSALKCAQQNPAFATSLRVVVDERFLNHDIVLRVPCAVSDSTSPT
jgi:hypothetical protein